MNKWTFDVPGQINGPSRLPQFMGGTNSPIYPMLYAQITRKFKGIDVYIGGENLTNYKQKHPILDSSRPIATNCNATMIGWPIMVNMVDEGIRLTVCN